METESLIRATFLRLNNSAEVKVAQNDIGLEYPVSFIISNSISRFFFIPTFRGKAIFLLFDLEVRLDLISLSLWFNTKARDGIIITNLRPSSLAK